jgi:hypothetical protein
MAAEGSADLYIVTLDDRGCTHLDVLEVAYDLDFVLNCFFC